MLRTKRDQFTSPSVVHNLGRFDLSPSGKVPIECWLVDADTGATAPDRGPPNGDQVGPSVGDGVGDVVGGVDLGRDDIDGARKTRTLLFSKGHDGSV